MQLLYEYMHTYNKFSIFVYGNNCALHSFNMFQRFGFLLQRHIGENENCNILLPLAVTSCLAIEFEFLVWFQWQQQLHSNCQVWEMYKWMHTTSATDPNTMTKCQMKDRKHINWTVIVTGSNAQCHRYGHWSFVCYVRRPFRFIAYSVR